MRENVLMKLTSLFQNKGEKLESIVLPPESKGAFEIVLFYNCPDLSIA